MITTYSLTINFRDGRTYNRSGLDREAAIGLKEWFIKSVPAAVSGSVTPEKPKSKSNRSLE